MTKTEFKKYIKTLDRASLEEMLLDLYSAHKNVREYIEYTANPNDNALFEKCKEIIKNEFYPKRGDGKMRFSVCRKAVSEFKAYNPAPELLADLMLCIPEYASEIAANYGDLWEQFYDSAVNNFEAAMKLINKNSLLPKFQKRIDRILKNCEDSGYGFPDSMWQVYDDYSNS